MGQPSPEPTGRSLVGQGCWPSRAFDLKMSITAVTVDDKGAMALPDRPTEIGWYAYGPRPGSAHGSAVLGGHVDSREYGVGPLVGLKQLRRGDDIIIKTTTGTERFRVTHCPIDQQAGPRSARSVQARGRAAIADPYLWRDLPSIRWVSGERRCDCAISVTAALTQNCCRARAR